MLTEEQVLEALGRVEDPELHRDIVTLGMVMGLAIDGSRVSFTLALTTAACPLRCQLTGRAHEAVAALPGVDRVQVPTGVMTEVERQTLFAGLSPAREQRPRPRNQVRRAIAVMSGKGGVGKSLVTAMLAVSLATPGHARRRPGRGYHRPQRAADVLRQQSSATRHRRRLAAARESRRHQGDEHQPAPSARRRRRHLARAADLGAIRQFWEEVIWGELDYLLVDLPPGTSDAAFTVMQSIPLNGVVLVTSPQGLAGMVVRKAAAMVRRVNVPLIGVMENMAYVACPDDGRAVRGLRPQPRRRACRGPRHRSPGKPAHRPRPDRSGRLRANRAVSGRGIRPNRRAAARSHP